MTIITRLLFYSTTLFILASCGTSQEPAAVSTDLIKITGQQFKNEGMQLGEIEIKAFENIVKCNGNIVPLPDGMARMTAPVSGVIKEINCANGKYVERNQPLIQISGNEVIDIQKDFAEASANYKRLKSEYERIKLLYEEKVSAEKEFITAESAFKVAMAEYNGLKVKIEAIGLSATQIENGEFYSYYILKAPIRGYISSLTANIGIYVDPQVTLCEIADPEKFQLRLSVFADQISEVKKGQNVRFKPVNSNRVFNATISSTGISVDSDSKSISCYASIEDKNYETPIANAFIEADIITRMDTVIALPTDAILKTETGYAFLVLQKQEGEDLFFEKKEIKPGRMNKGFTEILSKPIEGKLLVRGVYNVVAE